MGAACRREQGRDCSALAALRAAGAVLVGTTSMHELGFATTGVNEHYGVARNPFNVERLCGGSSTGEALSFSPLTCLLVAFC